MVDLIAANPITSMPEIKQLLRNVAIIYSPSTNCSNHEQYRQICYVPGSDRELPDQMTAAESLQILHLAARIQRLACMCLHSMQQKFVTAVEDSQGPLVAAKAAEPTSWMEEFRVYWVLWHLQHYSAFVEVSKARWAWPKDYIEDAKENFTTLNRVPRILTEQVWTVSAILADMGLRPLYGHPRSLPPSFREVKEEQEEESSKAGWTFNQYFGAARLPLFASLALPPNHHSYPVWSPPPIPSDNSRIERNWQRAPRHRMKETFASAMIRPIAGRTHQYPGFAQASQDLRYGPDEEIHSNSGRGNH
ncbi:uncharacterized protein DSM5745_02555 [Aspergillus mulundensis]|uniref:Uncharacterized protein n=1 Tax=Aspergillus mulundensis TaxID=1810919 RepID=A0A3D8SWX7_9EURO|nr:hypothetical protein DSM5745_02555 [Aspergillus mulundensis]RDW90780.1 hypothetical protein DSM5745_02555 [Aspergillus mulundensis]